MRAFAGRSTSGLAQGLISKGHDRERPPHGLWVITWSSASESKDGRSLFAGPAKARRGRGSGSSHTFPLQRAREPPERRTWLSSTCTRLPERWPVPHIDTAAHCGSSSLTHPTGVLSGTPDFLSMEWVCKAPWALGERIRWPQHNGCCLQKTKCTRGLFSAARMPGPGTLKTACPRESSFVLQPLQCMGRAHHCFQGRKV